MRRFVIGLLFSTAMMVSVHADQIKICAEPEYLIDFPDCPGCDQTLPRALPIARFAFDPNEVAKLKNITAMEFNMTMQGGDTAVGEFDYDKLSLGLGTVDTGLKLNGFPTGAQKEQWFAFTKDNPAWPSNEKLNQILADIKDDGLIDASILDATPGDNKIDLYSAFQTKLCIWGEIPDPPNPSEQEPEPVSVLVWVTAGALAYRNRRRMFNA